MITIALIFMFGIPAILEIVDCGNDGKHSHETRQQQKERLNEKKRNN